MLRQTFVVGLTAVIGLASATEADASAQWYGGYNYNPWAQQSHGSGYGYGSSPFGYGGKIKKLQKDVSYLVKQGTANNTRMTALETAISALQGAGGGKGPANTKELEERIAALEQRIPQNIAGIDKNDADIEGLDDRIWRSESDIAVLTAFASTNGVSISDNTAKVASNMMLIAANSATIASNAAVAIDSDQLASTVAVVNATIAANSLKINTNIESIA